MSSEQQTLRDLLTTQARRFEKRVFLEFGAEQYSYGAVDDQTDRVATALSRLGLRSGDKVALFLSNRPEFIFFFLGAPKLGLVLVPVDPSLALEDILFILRHSEALAVVTETRFLHKALELKAMAPGVRHWIGVDDGSPETARIEKLGNLTRGPVLGFWPDLDPEDVAAILYTRGTTGKPKAVTLTHRNFVSNSSQTIQPFRVNDTDRFFCSLPLPSIHAQVLLLLTPLAAGAACILRQGLRSETILEELSQSRATVLAGVPDMYAILAGMKDSEAHDLSALRLAICNSGPVGAETLEQFERRYDALIVQGYGLLEATCMTCANPYTGVRKVGSLGLPLPGQECRIVDVRGRNVVSGEIGEIVVRGPNVMKEYYRDPASSAQVLEGGWLHTSDLGYLDADGYYFLVGRKPQKQ